MSYFGRRFLGPLTLIAVSFAGLLLVLRSAAPAAFRHAAATTARAANRRNASTLGSELTWLTDAVVLGLHIAAYTACTLLVLAGPVAIMRLRARRQRAQTGRMPCAELHLGRDDQASPYEVSRVFDGIAGALRPLSSAVCFTAPRP